MFVCCSTVCVDGEGDTELPTSEVLNSLQIIDVTLTGLSRD